MTLEERYRLAEDEAKDKRRRKARRQPLLLIGLLDVLILAIAITVVIDLRRLATPQGTALAWTQAAVFGQCAEYSMLSVADPGRPEGRTDAQLCVDLQRATSKARGEVGQIALRVAGSRVTGRTASAAVGLQRPEGNATVVLDLRRVDGSWRVVRDPVSCAVVRCP